MDAPHTGVTQLSANTKIANTQLSANTKIANTQLSANTKIVANNIMSLP
jgi:hypothetical protein